MQTTYLPSPLNEQLAAALRQDRELAAARFDIHHETVPDFLHEYPYSVGAWPIFVSRGIVREQFEPLIQAMPRLFREALHARFDDSAAMTEYFGWPELVYHILEQAPVDDADLLVRYDAVLDASGLHLLESNCGSSAGGWQDDYFQLQMQQRLPCLAGSQPAHVEYRPILDGLLRTLISGMLRRRQEDAGGHLLVHYSFPPGGLNPPNFRKSLQRIYDAIKPPQLTGGRIHILHSFEEIGFTDSGEVTAQGQVMDALILGDVLLTDIPSTTLNRLITAHLSERLVFPDSPFHALVSDKGLFALLHECADEGLLDPADGALVRRFVPWTFRLSNAQIVVEGVQVETLPHLLRHKDEFVLKRFSSNSGRYVVVGRDCDPGEWHGALRHALEEKRWIAQQFCAPGLLDVHDPECGVVPHAMIWGLFGYGGKYAGAFVRGDHGAVQRGVINSTTGAHEFPVFEVE